MKDPEIAVVVTALVSDGPAFVPSQKRICRGCEAPVWASDNAVKMETGNEHNVPVEYTCFPCFSKSDIADEALNRPIAAVPGAMEDLQKDDRLSEIDKILLEAMTKMPLRELGL